MSKRIHLLDADFDGASYQSWPETDAPYKVRGKIETEKTVRHIAVCMTREQAEDTVRHLCSFLGMTVVGAIFEGS